MHCMPFSVDSRKETLENPSKAFEQLKVVSSAKRVKFLPYPQYNNFWNNEL